MHPHTQQKFKVHTTIQMHAKAAGWKRAFPLRVLSHRGVFIDAHGVIKLSTESIRHQPAFNERHR